MGKVEVQAYATSLQLTSDEFSFQASCMGEDQSRSEQKRRGGVSQVFDRLLLSTAGDGCSFSFPAVFSRTTISRFSLFVRQFWTHYIAI